MKNKVRIIHDGNCCSIEGFSQESKNDKTVVIELPCARFVKIFRSIYSLKCTKRQQKQFTTLPLTASICFFDFMWLFTAASPMFCMSKFFKQTLHLAWPLDFPHSIQIRNWRLLNQASLNLHFPSIVCFYTKAEGLNKTKTQARCSDDFSHVHSTWTNLWDWKNLID